MWGCYGAVLAVVVFSDCGPAPARRKRLKDQHTQSRPPPPPSNKKTTTNNNKKKKKEFFKRKSESPLRDPTRI